MAKTKKFKPNIKTVDEDPGRALDIVENLDLHTVKRVLVIYKFVGWVQLTNGRKKRVSRANAIKALEYLGQSLLPAGCTEVKEDLPLEDIKNVLFLYTSVAYVKLFTGRMVYVPREQADEFLKTSGDFMDRKVDQPWNDRRTFDVPFEDIVKIVKIGPKHTARVVVRDGTTVLVTKEHAEKFTKYLKEEAVPKILNEFRVQEVADDTPEPEHKRKRRRH